VDDSPDFYITFFVTAKGMQDVRTISTGGWYGWGGFWYRRLAAIFHRKNRTAPQFESLTD